MFITTYIENRAPSRNHDTIETKYKAILQVEKGVQKKLVAEQFGVPSSTLSTLLRSRDSIKSRCNTGTVGSKAKVMKEGHFVKTEQAILEYILQARAANIELTGTIIKIQAENFAKKLGESDFCGSKWLASSV